MEKKRYLKWYNKVGYGSGDLAGNVVYAFLSSFVMLYLTNTVGLNPGIIGTLIMVSKLFDGISDMFFGTMIDKTKSKLGKARPWMLYAYIGCAVTLVANFAIPDSLGTTAQYAWFFIAYTLLNAVFFTANNIAYASLVTFCTKNSRERVEMGSWRFIFAFSTSLLIQSVTVQFVRAAGGGAAAWRTVAVVYAIIGLIVNTISVFSIKELPEEELKAGKDHTEEKYSLVEAAKLLFSNKYYLMICATYICQQIYSAMLNMGIYYMKSTHNRRERPVCGHRGRSRGPFYYRITTFGKGPWDARDPHKTTFMALKHVIRLSIWQRQKETPGVEKAPGVSSPQRKESGRSGRDDGELRFGYDPAIHARRLRVYHRPRRLRMASRISIFFAARRFEPLNSMG